ncbi:hypothetical protein [Halocatena marina]|uniref:hypothetical protein n=1 Tax=Halocatena marina TaxID=2934937 RepID=UPI00200EA32A|nr:hypothetical protein [Halocatena marina]
MQQSECRASADFSHRHSLSLAALHAGTVGTALYSAHVVDEYVNAHIHGEESDRDRACTRWRGSLPTPRTPAVIGITTIFIVVLAAIKASIDRLDLVFDWSINKRTVPAALGERRATLVNGFLCAV